MTRGRKKGTKNKPKGEVEEFGVVRLEYLDGPLKGGDIRLAARLGVPTTKHVYAAATGAFALYEVLVDGLHYRGTGRPPRGPDQESHVAQATQYVPQIATEEMAAIQASPAYRRGLEAAEAALASSRG